MYGMLYWVCLNTGIKQYVKIILINANSILVVKNI